MHKKSFREKLNEVAEYIDLFPELPQSIKDLNAEFVRLMNGGNIAMDVKNAIDKLYTTYCDVITTDKKDIDVDTVVNNEFYQALMTLIGYVNGSQCKKSSPWTAVQDGMPEKNYHREIDKRYIVRVQDISGGFLRNSYHFEVCDFRGTMCHSEYFSINQPGIVTHWMEIPIVTDEE